jgi:hypothetical protein
MKMNVVSGYKTNKRSRSFCGSDGEKEPTLHIKMVGMEPEQSCSKTRGVLVRLGLKIILAIYSESTLRQGDRDGLERTQEARVLR